jgi:hypothetical protein
MSDDYVVASSRKSKNDKRAKGRYNKYKKGGALRTENKKVFGKN